MKRIEDGCRAVIINSRCGNDGLVVTVGHYIGASPRLAEPDVWEIDRLIPSTNGWMSMEIPEENLKRIDYDGDEKTTWVELQRIWRPSKITEDA